MSKPKRFHLGWFVNFTVNAWNDPWADSNSPDWTGGFYVDMARALDRACFDYMILEDTCMVSDAYGGSFESSLKHAVFAPKHDPVPLVPLIATATGIEGMKAYRDDVRARMEAHGRKPEDCKVLFLVSPILGDTEEEAQRKRQAMISAPDYIEETLIGMASITEIDFSTFDLDAPLPLITTNGERGSLDKFAQWGSGKTLRQLAAERVDRSIELVGTPDQVAARMGEVMDEIGGDGFLITRPGMTGLTRKYIIEITDGLTPALQRRGLARTDYTCAHFRDNLLEF